MKYTPFIKSANTKHKLPLGKHIAVLYSDIVSGGSVEYTWVLGVFDDASKEPCYFVAAEVNEMALLTAEEMKELELEYVEQGSHFLGFFDAAGHHNLGDSNVWADEATFTAEALRIIREKLALSV